MFYDCWCWCLSGRQEVLNVVGQLGDADGVVVLNIAEGLLVPVIAAQVDGNCLPAQATATANAVDVIGVVAREIVVHYHRYLPWHMRIIRI